MVKPSNFILTTDFATLKNDATGSFSFTVPASEVVAPASFYYASYDLTIGTAGAPARTYINSSASPSNWFFGPNLQIAADGTNSVTGPITYSYFVFISRTAPDVVTANVLIPNTAPSGNLTTEGTVRTITVLVNTFIPPFSS